MQGWLQSSSIQLQRKANTIAALLLLHELWGCSVLHEPHLMDFTLSRQDKKMEAVELLVDPFIAQFYN